MAKKANPAQSRKTAGDYTNVVFILSDDQGPWALGCGGNPEIVTPNIDRLAAGGVRLENFFCTSPVCSPARASLMTGRIPSQHGVHDWIHQGDMPPDALQYLGGLTCYTDLLAANGYMCGLSGKWHLGDSMTPQHGFSHWFAMPKGASIYQDARMIRDGEVVTCPGYLTDVITDDAIGFIDRNRGRKFYLSVHYNAPHHPWDDQPKELVDLYANGRFESCPQEPPHPWAVPWSKHFLGDREALKGYFATVTGMDRAVGRIIDRLDALGLREKTLVVFCSDNGYSCGHHGFWHKGNGTFPLNMYENSVRVPCIFNQPGSLAPRASKALTSQYDVIHTLLEHLRLPAFNDPTLPGRSFLPILKGRTDQAHQRVVVYDEYGPVRMIRTEEWKYVYRYPYGPHELYHLAKDPDERKNLVDEKDRQSVVDEMRGRLAGWFAQYVIPQMDGSRFPVTGNGQMAKIDDSHPGEQSFQPM